MKIFCLLISFGGLILLSGCFKEDYRSFKELSNKYQKVAIINASFDKRIYSTAKDVYGNISGPKYNDLRDIDTAPTQEDIQFLNASGKKILDKLNGFRNVTLIMGETVIRSNAYQEFLKKNLQTKSNPLSVQIDPYIQGGLLKEDIQKICEELHVDAVATLHFAYSFFIHENSIESLVKTITSLDRMKSIFKVFTNQSNGEGLFDTIGLVGDLHVYNKKGQEIYEGQIQILANKNKNKDLKLKGFSFHLYPEYKESFERCLDLEIISTITLKK
jgi:spore cortex formation protein SpoVR/YcgB (stage V sporulation)